MKTEIIRTLKEKALLKQQIYDVTFSAFNQIKEVIKNIVADYNAELKDVDKRIRLEYTDGGEFTSQLKIAGDVLVFSMHSNIFEFPNSHEIWRKTDYKANVEYTYSGIISIYNFLADSFKYDRREDEGYLLGRLFINKENSFFTDGLRELGFIYPEFGKNFVTEQNMKTIVEAAIFFALKFDLFVPGFESVQTMYVEDVLNSILKAKLKTGKRLGFQYTAQKEETS
jgi:hypothetical protein